MKTKQKKTKICFKINFDVVVQFSECLAEEGQFFIVSPKDVVLAKPRNPDDHVQWLMEHQLVSQPSLRIFSFYILISKIESTKKPWRQLRDHKLVN